MTDYKYMAACGLGGWTVVGNNKSKLIKAFRDYCKADYELYLKTMAYLGDEPTLTLEDFTCDLYIDYFSNCVEDVIHEIL